MTSSKTIIVPPGKTQALVITLFNLLNKIQEENLCLLFVTCKKQRIHTLRMFDAWHKQCHEVITAVFKQVDILRDVEAQRREREKKNKRLGIFSTAAEVCGENEQVVQLLYFHCHLLWRQDWFYKKRYSFKDVKIQHWGDKD